MRKRPLCMVCLILLAIQLVRVSFLQNTKDQKPSLAETLISDEKDVYSLARSLLEDRIEHHEEMYMVLLDQALKVLGVAPVSKGGISITINCNLSERCGCFLYRSKE